MRIESLIKKINMYEKGVHSLNKGASLEQIKEWEISHNFCIPDEYKKILKVYNGGELFALPAGVCFFGIENESGRSSNTFYLGDNFNSEKHKGLPDYFFAIGDYCDGNTVGFDLRKTTDKDGIIIEWDSETGNVIDEWNWTGIFDWFDEVMRDGAEEFDIKGNERNAL